MREIQRQQSGEERAQMRVRGARQQGEERGRLKKREKGRRGRNAVVAN